MGIGEGVAMPAMTNILSKWIPVSERSRSLALVYSGMHLGSVTGLAFSPKLIHKFGWPSVFYCFGSLGSIWLAVWLNKVLHFNLTDSGLVCVLPWLFTQTLGAGLQTPLLAEVFQLLEYGRLCKQYLGSLVLLFS
ncbi:hypothetical protein Drorol1_Dr00021584 [Drosera rotundifolia]